MSRRVRVRENPEVEAEEQEREALAEEARQYAHLKKTEVETGEERKSQGKVVLPLMKELKVTKHKVDYSADEDAVVSIKTRENAKIDEERLKKALGATKFNKLTSKVLDEAKVEAAINLGEIDPNVVASCTDFTPVEYLEVRFTRKRKRAR
jgi:hypothetical protein